MKQSIQKYIQYILVLISAVVLSGAMCSRRPDPFSGVDKEYRDPSNRWEDIEYLFDLDALPLITLEVSTNEWHTLLETYTRREDVRANFIFEKKGNTERFDDIGLRTRGGMSLLPPQAISASTREIGEYSNAHFRVSFNTFVESGRFLRQRNLILRFHNVDPLYARDIFTHDLLRRFGVLAPRASYARVQVRFMESGETVNYGVHVMTEHIDRSFLRTRFGNNMGFLWKCGDGARLTYPLGAMRASPGRARYSMKTHNEERGVLFDNALAELEYFVENIKTREGKSFETWIEEAMDVEGLLRATAVMVVVGSWDSYWFNSKNYYLYQDVHRRWHFIPVDFDFTLGTGFEFAGDGDIDFSTHDVFEWGREENILLHKIMQRPKFRAMYAEYLKELLDPENSHFTPEAVAERIRTWHALIDPYVSPAVVDTMPCVRNNYHIIEDTSKLKRSGGYPKTFRVLSGDESDNFVIRRINSARKQLGLE